MSGWISLHRQIKHHWVFKNDQYFKAWITIILEVNHHESKVLIDTDLIECKRGQSLNSLQTWCNIFGKNWSIQKVRTFFKLLENDSMIQLEGLRKTTRLTVCKYDSYQDNQHTTNRQLTDKQQTTNTQLTTNNNDNKENKNNNTFTPPTAIEVLDYCIERNNFVNAETFIDFYESKGWMVGKNKMKDWKACVRTWEKTATKPIQQKDEVSDHYTNHVMNQIKKLKAI